MKNLITTSFVVALALGMSAQVKAQSNEWLPPERGGDDFDGTSWWSIGVGSNQSFDTGLLVFCSPYSPPGLIEVQIALEPHRFIGSKGSDAKVMVRWGKGSGSPPPSEVQGFEVTQFDHSIVAESKYPMRAQEWADNMTEWSQVSYRVFEYDNDFHTHTFTTKGFLAQYKALTLRCDKEREGG